MANILAIGIATLDIINHVDAYPAEDEELRTLSQQQTRGGNATNSLVVLSQLGHDVAWSGVLIDEPDSTLIQAELDHYQIDTQACLKLNTGKMPTSYITVSAKTGSRTIVHHRDCPELPFTHFKTIDLTPFDWVHFEGRPVDELGPMIKWLKQHYPHIPCSLEVEKPRPDIEDILHFADVIMFSQPYAMKKGFHTAETFLTSQSESAMMTCTWGEQGAWLKSGAQLFHSPAFPPQQVIDTLAAGDTFNAGLIDGLVQQRRPAQALESACRLAGKKCGQQGLHHLVERT